MTHNNFTQHTANSKLLTMKDTQALLVTLRILYNI